jgi:phosphate uptake regulator
MNSPDLLKTDNGDKAVSVSRSKDMVVRSCQECSRDLNTHLTIENSAF